MTKSENINELAGALAAAQIKFEPVKKSKTAKVFSKKTNKEFTYHYADLADVLQMALPILAANGLSFAQLVESEQNKLAIISTLMHKSGQWIQTTFSVTVPQEERMSEIQGMGSAITYLRRYTASAMLGISSEEDDDASAAGDTVKGNTAQSPSSASARPQTPPSTPKPPAAQPAQAAPRQQAKQPSGPVAPTPEQHQEIQKLLATLQFASDAGEINETVFRTWLDKFVLKDGTYDATNLDARAASLKQAYAHHYQRAKEYIENNSDAEPSNGEGNASETFDDDVPWPL